jgi:hypothetical protein
VRRKALPFASLPRYAVQLHEPPLQEPAPVCELQEVSWHEVSVEGSSAIPPTKVINWSSFNWVITSFLSESLGVCLVSIAFFGFIVNIYVN